VSGCGAFLSRDGHRRHSLSNAEILGAVDEAVRGDGPAVPGGCGEEVQPGPGQRRAAVTFQNVCAATVACPVFLFWPQPLFVLSQVGAIRRQLILAGLPSEMGCDDAV